MKRFAGMLVLASMGVACRDEPVSTTTTTSQVLASDPTAIDQSNERADLAKTAEVRRHLVADEQLGIRAKNVVVVIRDGVVTLRGDVASQAEHDRILAIVTSVPEVGRLDDRIRIADGEKR